MGASAREIEREIRQTRDRLDANLDELEDRAASKAVTYGRIAAIALGVVAVGGAAYLIYRRTRKPTLKDRLDAVSMDSLRELGARLRDEMPSVTVKVNEESPREPGLVESIVRKVGPAIVGTASTAVLERVARTGDDQESETEAAAP